MPGQTSNVSIEAIRAASPAMPSCPESKRLESYRKRIVLVAIHIQEAETPDGIVLHDDVHGMQFPLDLVWSKVWRLLKERQSFDFIADSLVQECGVPRETVEVDLCAFIDMLQNDHLLENTDAGPPAERSFWRTFLCSLFRLSRRTERKPS